MELEYFENAIEASWEEYEEHMLRTGQWMTLNDYMLYMDGGLDEAFYSQLDYESATHGC